MRDFDVHPVDLTLPDLPARLEGLRIGQLSDLHVKTDRARYRQVAQAMGALQLDLAILTGDYMCKPGDEPVAHQVLQRICENLRPRFGSVGVFGNHDTHELRQLCQSLPVTWLNNSVHRPDGLPLQIAGFEMLCNVWPDSLATLAAMCNSKDWPDEGSGTLRILLSHQPTYLLTAADLRFDLMFSGHTHGGQIRLPYHRALVNGCEFPANLTSGLLRHRRTLCAISRGLGESWFALRLFCQPQVPVYTLHRGPMLGSDTDEVQNVYPW